MAPAKRKNSKKNGRATGMIENWEKHDWKPVFSHLGWHEEKQIQRLTKLLAMHLMIDSLLTAALSAQFLNRRPGVEAEASKIEEIVNRIAITARIDLARTAQVISDSCAADLKAVNAVRNRFAHCHPEDPKEGWGLEKVSEITSEKAFNGCMRRGYRAGEELTDAIVNAYTVNRL